MQRVILSVVCAIVIFVCYSLLNSANFERISPSVGLFVVNKDGSYNLNSSFFNPNNGIELRAFDQSGLSNYNVRITNKNGEVLLHKEEVLVKRPNKIEVLLPKLSSIAPDLKDGDEVTYTIQVQDWSNANFFRGNETTITKKLIVSTELPKIHIIATSKKVSHGGSALIAFSIEDLPLYRQIGQNGIHRIFIRNGKHDFDVYRFVNRHGNVVYLSLAAWTLDSSYFDAEIHLIDKAMNENVVKVAIDSNINSVMRKINVSTHISEKYLNKMIDWLDLVMVFPNKIDSNIEKFQFFNTSIRKEDDKKIASFSQISQVGFAWNESRGGKIALFNAFLPLRYDSVSGRFGDEQTFLYQKENIGQVLRLGVDLICDRGLPVLNSNEGYIVHAGKMGAYGNVAILNHILGLSAVYGHLKEVPNISGGVREFDTIGKSGISGFASQNGIYLMTLVQGHFVNPREWMNAEWLDENINQVLEVANNFGANRN